MDPVLTKILEGIPYSGMGSTLERNALIGYIRNLINQDKYTVEMILSLCESVGYSRQMAEDVFKELTGLSPKLIVNNNAYYDMPAGVPNMCIAWGISKSTKDKAYYIVPFEYGYATMETDGINAPIPTVISATIPEAFDELKKVAKNIQTLDKIITKKLLETENVQSPANDVHQVNLPYSASPLQILKKSFKDKVLSVSEFERQASKMLQAGELTVDEAEDLMNWKQDLIDEDESYANEVLENNEKWNEVQATVEFDDIYNELKEIAHHDDEYGFNKDKVRAIFEANKDMFQEVDLIEAVNRLYQLLLGFSKEEILGHSEFKGKSAAEIDDSNFDYTYITKEEWDNTPTDYKMLINGIKYMMFPADHPENGGKLCPVKIKDDSLKQSSKKQSGIVPTEKITLEDGRTFTVRYNPNEKSITTILDEDGKEIGVDFGTRLQLLRKLFHKGEPTIVNKSASKKVKSDIKKDSNFEKALSYVEERISNDNNNENDSYPLAFEEAENLFGIDADKLQEEYDRRTMTWRKASKKVTADKLGQEEYKGYIINIWQDPGLGKWNYEVKDKESDIMISENHNLENLRLAQTLSKQDVDYMTEHFDKKSACKKVTAENLVDNKFYLEMNNLDKEQDSELLNALQKFYDIVGFVPPLWDKDIDWYLLSHNLQIAYEKKGGSISNFKGYTSADNKLLTKELLQSLYPNNSSELINLLSDIEDITPSGKVLRKYDDLDSIRFKSRASKKVTAENMTLDDIEAEDNKDQVQEEIEKINETPVEDIFAETTPEQYLDKALQEDKVDTINDVVSKCIDKFSEKFKDFNKYQVKILSYNTKVLGDYEPTEDELVEDKELNANAILQVILQITNNADETSNKKVLVVFSITNGELHWTGTVRGENDQVVAFTEEGLDALFEVDEPSEEELEDII